MMTELEELRMRLEAENKAWNEEECICAYCGQVAQRQNGRNLNLEWYCDDCIEELFCECKDCGALILKDAAVLFNDDFYCDGCFHDITTICDHCGEIVFRDDTHSDFHITICPNCFDDYYFYCDRCDRLEYIDYREENEDYNYLCRTCYEEIEGYNILNYNYKPTPLFYRNDFEPYPLYLGVELEIDKAGEYGENARNILNIANCENDTLYCKHDGSLSDGFEMVSHPMSLEYHSNTMKWKDIFAEALDMGYRSHNTSTCGLHLHVNRSFFGDTWEEQEENIGKVVHMVEAFWNELVIFSRRNIDRLNQWANRTGVTSKVKDTYKKAKEYSGDRYRAVNLCNNSTIEFRIFRGTLKYSTFLATLQLIDYLCRTAKDLTELEIERLSWSVFVKNITDTELINYLKEKNLYINENVEIEESEEM